MNGIFMTWFSLQRRCLLVTLIISVLLETSCWYLSIVDVLFLQSWQALASRENQDWKISHMTRCAILTNVAVYTWIVLCDFIFFECFNWVLTGINCCAYGCCRDRGGDHQLQVLPYCPWRIPQLFSILDTWSAYLRDKNGISTKTWNYEEDPSLKKKSSSISSMFGYPSIFVYIYIYREREMLWASYKHTRRGNNQRTFIDDSYPHFYIGDTNIWLVCFSSLRWWVRAPARTHHKEKS